MTPDYEKHLDILFEASFDSDSIAMEEWRKVKIELREGRVLKLEKMIREGNPGFDSAFFCFWVFIFLSPLLLIFARFWINQL